MALGGAETAGVDPVFRIGDTVELLTIPRGRERRLAVGDQGVVEVANDGDTALFDWLTVRFPSRADRRFLLAPRHLRRVVQP